MATPATDIHEENAAPEAAQKSHAAEGVESGAASVEEQAHAEAEEHAGGGHAIVLAAETIGHIGPLPVTNTLLVSWIVMVFLIIVAVLVNRSVSLIPKWGQNFVEMIIEPLYNMAKDLAGARAKVFFPIVVTFFIYIATANIFGLFPGFATIGFYEMHDGVRTFVPLLRSINSDLNMTLALALVSAFATHYFAVKYLGIKGYIAKWVSFNPIFLFVGLLEVVSEFTKILSLSMRLFGNIFAGEVVLATIAGLFAFVAPLPFYFLEIIVAFVQAAVFMMLTLVFMVLLSEKHEAH